MYSIHLNNLFNILFALILGAIVGYERTYNGRAAGMRTYSLVAMASCALITVLAHPEYWFNNPNGMIAAKDPTRVIQGIVTGIGFLCGGVILKDRFSISGLTTAASIWACSVIGMLVGLQFYLLALFFTFSQFCLMFWLFKLEIMLPARHSIMLHIHFSEQNSIDIQKIKVLLQQDHYQVIPLSISLNHNKESELSLTAFSQQKKHAESLIKIANKIKKIQHVIHVTVAYSRH